jgi:hypothetical protein
MLRLFTFYNNGVRTRLIMVEYENIFLQARFDSVIYRHIQLQLRTCNLVLI